MSFLSLTYGENRARRERGCERGRAVLHGERDLQRKPQLMISGNYYPARGALSACARVRAW